jgi:hypothetical protein
VVDGLTKQLVGSTWVSLYGSKKSNRSRFSPFSCLGR